MDTALVYSNGRYFIGPDKHFIKYQADAHLEVRLSKTFEKIKSPTRQSESDIHFMKR